MNTGQSSDPAGDGWLVRPEEAPIQGRPGFVPIVVVAAATVVLGVGAGLLWRVVAPRVPIVKAEDGFLYAESQPEQAVAADGWFGFLGVIAGVLVAVAAWLFLRRRRGAVVLAVLVLGSLAGAWLGWWLGVQVEVARFEALVPSIPVGGRLDAPLSLRITDLDHQRLWPPTITGVVVAQALAAAVAYTVLAGFATDPDLRPGRPQPSEVAWAGPDEPDQTVRPDQTGPAALAWPALDASAQPPGPALELSPQPAPPAAPKLSSDPGGGSDRTGPPVPP